MNENGISIEISLKFVSKGPFDNIPALVQIMVWHRPGDWQAITLTEITDSYMRHSASISNCQAPAKYVYIYIYIYVLWYYPYASV